MKGDQTISRICGKAKLSLKRGSPTILSCIGAIGVVATAALAAKATPEVDAICDELYLKYRDVYDKEPKTIDYIREAWKCYIPTAVVGLSTIACIFGANALNKRQQAAITSAYMLLDNTYKQYKEKVSKLLGDNADTIVKKSIIEDQYSEIALFYEYHYGEFFERRKADVLNAEYQLNLKFASQGYACLNDFFELLGLPITQEGEVIGWSTQEGYSAIDFEHQLLELDDGMECTIINLPISPSICY